MLPVFLCSCRSTGKGGPHNGGSVKWTLNSSRPARNPFLLTLVHFLTAAEIHQTIVSLFCQRHLTSLCFHSTYISHSTIQHIKHISYFLIFLTGVPLQGNGPLCLMLFKIQIPSTFTINKALTSETLSYD